MGLLKPFLTAIVLLTLAGASARAATLITTNVEGAGADWTAAIWKTNAASTNFFAPLAGNVYQCISNGTPFGNSKNNTRIRNPAAAGWLTFPGDSLTLNTNTELRMKQPGAILNFPGVSGGPGLILDGGVLNPGDDAVFVITGKVQVAAQSYLCAGNNGGGAAMPLRGVNVAGQLTGTGTVVVMQASNTVAQQISGGSNTFTGQWIVKAGWLLGSGLNALGTNSITVDPNYSLPLDSSVVNVAGPAWLEPGYDLDSAGQLILTNGGLMVLHQNCAFSSVLIQGTALGAGTHYYAELATNFPNNFATNGSGSITVQPYGPLSGFPPRIVAQPASVSLLVGSAAQLTASTSGSPTSYQWQKGTNGLFVKAVDSGDMTGSRTNVLAFTALTYSDGADYRLVVTNGAGSATSQVATITVLAPVSVDAASPAAGSTVSNLTQVQVTFNRNVTFADASDFLVNGQPATSVFPAIGGVSNYTFTFTQPSPGQVTIGWDAGQSISDLFGNPFNASAPGSTWTYTLIDTVPPAIGDLSPAPGATVNHLTQIAVTFTKPVLGVHATALLINGIAATNVTGSGSGPYLFQFRPPANGTVQFAWATPNGIRDTASPPNAFAGGSWTVTVNPAAGPPAVRINEFLANNISTNGLTDEFGDLNPWIELYNFGTNDINLAGYSLTDDPTIPNMWVFPPVTIPAGQFLIVFADGLNLNTVSPTNYLHASFSLTAAGAYLGLFDDESPPLALTEFSPQYPPQRNDYSYGYDGTNQLRYFSVPTPGAPNGFSSITGIVADVHFSVQRGFFDQPFNLLLTTPTPGATIRYTIDGSQPTAVTTGDTYTNALYIDRLLVVRAAAFLTNSLPSLVQTHSYIFLTNALNQPPDPPGFPITTGWSINGWTSEYAMNPLVVTNPLYAAEINADLLAVPTLSVAVKTDEMFGPNGIYTNSPPRTSRPEIECSVELIYPDGTPGFQTDCGIKIHGGGSAQKPMKKPLALKFQSSFGPGSLNYRFFPDSPVDKFTGGIVLRADYNNSWTHALTPYGASSIDQRSRGDLVRDALYKDLQLVMGDLGSHSRYVHLYINGLYWGLYNPCEDPDRHFAAAYLGGSPDDYDSIKGSDNQLAVDGDTVAYNFLQSLNTPALANLAQYNQIQQYLDVKQYADYMLLQFYGANQDWGTAQNWVAVHNKNVPGSLWEYLCWDDERTLEGVNDTPMGNPLNYVSPSNLQTNLARNPEYRLLFADRAYKFLFNNGILTSNGIPPLWLGRSTQIYLAIVGESARWGNSVPGGKLPISPLPYPTYDTNTPYYSRDENFLGEQGRLLTNYFPFRTTVVLNQLRGAGLYPSVDAPVFNQFGGNVPFGFKLTITATAGTIYYTTNGVDPRVYGTGSVSPQALPYTNALTLNLSCIIGARSLSNGVWSALAQGTFAVSSLGVPLEITEIMYNPPGGAPYTYINVQNLGALPLDVSGFDFKGIGYTFPSGTTLKPGQVVLLANDTSPSAFAARYPGAAVFDYFGGSLDPGGERLAILDRNGQTITAVTYDNGKGWPAPADGGGYSLQIVDPYGDLDSPANWRASSLPNGTPGLPSIPPPLGSVLLNEVMASNFAAVQNGTNFPDWLELYNRSSNAVDLANWSLSNSGNERKFVFPGNTPLAPGGYLVVWCDSNTNDPGLHSGFKLGKSGENLFLYDTNTNRIDAMSFGEQVTDLSLGRINGQWQLTVPTPNAANVPTATDSPTNIAINEWMANPAPGGTNWIEVYNRSSNAPVALHGLYLAASNSLFQIRSYSFLPTNGFLQLFVDTLPGPEQVDLTLPASGSELVLYDSSGVQLDSISYGPQAVGVSQGRLPDGSANIVTFPGTPSPGAPNYLITYAGPILNEVMAKNVSAVRDSRGNTPDWLELYNPRPTNFVLAGMSLSAGAGDSWVFPAGTTISSNSYLIVWCDTTRPPSTNVEAELNTGFDLSASGTTVFLITTNGQLADSVSFGFQVADLSIGRDGGAWSLQVAPSPGAANPGPCALGNPGNLRINEWMAAPTTGNDWFELYNVSTLPVALAGLFLSDDPSLSGMTNSPIPPVSFIGPLGWVVFQADANLSHGPNHVAFSLDRNGETLRLYTTDLTLIDAVDFGLQDSGVSQGRFPDGTGAIVSFLGSPTPGAANRLLTPPLGATLLSGGVMQLSWPTSSTPFTLLSTSNLDSDAVWLPAAEPVLVSNSVSLVTIVPTNGARFFRLGF